MQFVILFCGKIRLININFSGVTFSIQQNVFSKDTQLQFINFFYLYPQLKMHDSLSCLRIKTGFYDISATQIFSILTCNLIILLIFTNFLSSSKLMGVEILCLILQSVRYAFITHQTICSFHLPFRNIFLFSPKP